MDERIYELDSQGDITFLIYDVPKALPQTPDQLHPRMLDGSKPDSTISSLLEEKEKRNQPSTSSSTQDPRLLKTPHPLLPQIRPHPAQRVPGIPRPPESRPLGRLDLEINN